MRKQEKCLKILGDSRRLENNQSQICAAVSNDGYGMVCTILALL